MTQAKRSIPIRISPFFFLTAGLIGYYISRNFTGMLIWIGVIFISIIVHEFGHALISRAFGQNPQIELTAFGGVTYATQPKISLPKEFLVVLAGPCFGFSLFLIGEALILLKVFSNPLILSFLDIIVTVNFLWTILNLIPVLPLDGGQLMRIILEGVFGYKGRHGAFIASMIVSLLIAMAFIFFQNFIISILFFLFAFQNFEYARQIRTSTRVDENDELKGHLAKAEQLVTGQKFEEAISLLEEIRARSKAGMVFQLATQDLAKVQMSKGDFNQAYELLKPNLKSLSDTGKVLLHKAAFEVGDFDTVLSLSGNCLVNLPDSDLVLRSAAAAAAKNDLEAAMGWLETAKDFGCDHIKEFLEKDYFNPIREKSSFQSFIQSLHG